MQVRANSAVHHKPTWSSLGSLNGLSYAPLPGSHNLVDPESGATKKARSRGRMPLTAILCNAIRKSSLKAVVLASIAIALFGLCVYNSGLVPWDRFFRLQIFGKDESDLWSSTYRIGPQLPFVPADGEHAPLKNGAAPAVWPQDYPEAASYIRNNSIIRDITDPWPEKPWIASIWLAPERFPAGLHGQPYEEKPLPEMGRENGEKPSPGLHDPPLPQFPASQMPHKPVKQVPRQDLRTPKDWHAQPGMPVPRRMPPVQALNFARNRKRMALTKARQQWVKRAFLHAYEGYKKHAFGHDEIRPITRGTRDSYNAWGATTVDSLDLLLIMDLSHEYNVARTHVRSLDFSLLVDKKACDGRRGPTVHLFETVIRYLGGFLSTYDLSGDELMLQRAKELGDWLLPAFNTASGWPHPHYSLGSNPNGADFGRTSTAEVGSLSMEFTRLSQITGDPTFSNTALRLQEHLSKLRGKYGTLMPHYISPGATLQGEFTIGGLIDSYYEYLIKMVQLLGDPQSVWGEMYQKATHDITRYLAVNVTITPDRSGVVLLGSIGYEGRVRPVLEHLGTFAGGMFALGSRLLSKAEDLLLASELTESAVWAYRSCATGLMPEQMHFYNPEDEHRLAYIGGQNETRARVKGSPLGSSHIPNKGYYGRPESIESVFYMYRITGDPKWQDYGWRMFTSWVKHSLTSVGFANIADVNKLPPSLQDNQESFVLTETLKYYYLLFSSPDLLSLDDYVFNTEAHPFKVPLRAHRNFWSGPEQKVDAAYADPRDRHFFDGGNPKSKEAPTGRGTARQQQWRADHCT